MSADRPPVVLELQDGIALITLDSPPVNTGTAELRSALLRAIEDSEGVRGVVLRSALRHFYAGSDLREFDGPIREPELPAVIAALDALEVPIVAVLTGSTLGGGLEVALAADVRIATPTLQTGFPESALGMLPGAGGTVRASRLIGVPATIDLVATARRLDADEALGLGLVDEIVGADAALGRALELVATTPKRRLRDLPVPLADERTVDEVVARVVTRRTRPNVVRAVALIREGVSLGGAAALAAERALFTELRGGDEARALRSLFFAKSAAAKSLRGQGEAIRIEHVGVAGAGTMGSAIAIVAARAGWAVTVFDTATAVLERATARFADAGLRIATTERIDDLAGCDVVVDAVFEDVAVKQGLLRALDAVLAPAAVIASNTSYLDLDLLASVLADPSRLAGLHFFNPADTNPLVEVVRTATSSQRTLATLGAIVRATGKTGILARVGEGFVANRVYADYRGQAEFLLEDGASPESVDAAMVAFGMAIGPFAVGDLSGLDIAWARRKRLAATRDPAQRYVAIPDRVCELGRLGRKTDAGWYDYSPEHRRGAPSPVVARIIEEERDRKGIVARSIDDAEIVRRILCAMVVAAATVVQTGVAERASDVDVALTEGFAFPRSTGGPVRFAAAQDRGWLIDGLAAVHRSDPIGFALAVDAGRGLLPPAVERLLG